MVAEVAFARVLELPDAPEPNTVYFAKPADADTGKLFVTGNDGAPIEFGAVDSTQESTGAADEGRVPSLDPDGRLSASLLTGGLGYANITQIVLGAGNYPPPGDGQGPGVSSTGQRAPLQIVYNADDPDGFAVQITSHGSGLRRAGAGTIYVHTPSDDPSDYSEVSPIGAPIKLEFYQASNGNGGTAHAGTREVRVDGNIEPGTLGEIPSRDIVTTCTGYARANSPGYYGNLDASVFNRFQQHFRPGQTYWRLLQSGVAMPTYGANTDFGANELVGPGGSLPGRAPRKNILTGTKLLEVPERGAVEHDEYNDEHRTDGSAIPVRGRVVLAKSPRIPWTTFAVNPNATRTLRSGSNWLEITMGVAAAAIDTLGAVSRLNISPALSEKPAIVGFYVDGTDAGPLPGTFRITFTGGLNALFVELTSGKMNAGQTYTFGILFG